VISFSNCQANYRWVNTAAPCSCQKVTVKSLSFAQHNANPSRRGDGQLENVPRHGRSPASFLRVLSRSVSRRAAPVTSGTAAAAFVALGSPRPHSVLRPFELLRGVALRPVAYGCRNSPRSTLMRVLANLRRTARRQMFARMSERFASQGLKGLGPGAGQTVADKQRVGNGGGSTKLN